MPVERVNYVDCLLFSCEVPDDARPLDDSTALTRGDYACCYASPTGVGCGEISSTPPLFSPATVSIFLEHSKSYWRTLWLFGHRCLRPMPKIWIWIVSPRQTMCDLVEEGRTITLTSAFKRALNPSENRQY
ncbi:hypothetical protein VTO73DRAFT_11490 [Trametes versicolor]